MSRASVRKFALPLLAGVLLTAGCQSSSPEMTMPTRPAELDKLAAFMGEWEGTFECKMGGETVTGGGASQISWEADRQVLLERGRYWMGEPAEGMSGVGMWVYDPKAGNYQMFWYDTTGDMSHGTATCDAEGRKWKMTMRGRNVHTGKTTHATGTSEMIDANTNRWSMTMTDAWGAPVMEMTGTSKRKQ